MQLFEPQGDKVKCAKPQWGTLKYLTLSLTSSSLHRTFSSSTSSGEIACPSFWLQMKLSTFKVVDMDNTYSSRGANEMRKLERFRIYNQRVLLWEVSLRQLCFTTDIWVRICMLLLFLHKRGEVKPIYVKMDPTMSMFSNFSVNYRGSTY